MENTLQIYWIIRPSTKLGKDQQLMCVFVLCLMIDSLVSGPQDSVIT